MAGKQGFEPWTSGFGDQRSTGLSYSPIVIWSQVLDLNQCSPFGNGFAIHLFRPLTQLGKKNIP